MGTKEPKPKKPKPPKLGSEPKPANCYACGAPIVGPFCAQCGQKHDDCRRSILHLIGETISANLQLDSRLARTFGSLAYKPGSLTREFGHGKRSPYTPPVRLYVFISVLFFAVLALTNTYFVTVVAETRELSAEELAANEERYELARAQAAEEGVELPQNTAREATVFKLRFFRNARDIHGPTLDADVFFGAAGAGSDAEDPPDPPDGAAPEGDTATAGEEAAGDAPTGGVRIDLGEGPVDDDRAQRILRAIFGALSDPAQLNQPFNQWLPRVMFLMVPVLALITAIFVRGRDAIMYDHLILSLNMHAGVFVLLSVAVLAVQFGVIGNLVAMCFFLSFFVYLWIALKGAFQRGVIKTTLVTVFAGALYWVLMFSAIMGIVIWFVVDLAHKTT